LAVATEKHGIKLISTETKTILKTLSHHKGPVLSVAYSNDNKYLASGGGNDETETAYVLKIDEDYK
jgi:WD40 repeat protein